MFTISSSQDLFFLILAIAIGAIAIFLCWALYEVALMLRKANEVVDETRAKIARVEHALLSIKEKLESSVNYLGVFAAGWKTFLGLFQDREEKKEQRRRTKKTVDEDEE